MKCYRVTRIAIPAYPVIRLTFDDGLTGDIDLGADILRGPIFAPLKDEAIFRQVALADDGRSFGWNLDVIGSEIDLGADAARADIETALVIARAEKFRARTNHAAE
jgi:Protein of unknown function (DUF2442)